MDTCLVLPPFTLHSSCFRTPHNPIRCLVILPTRMHSTIHLSKRALNYPSASLCALGSCFSRTWDTFLGACLNFFPSNAGTSVVVSVQKASIRMPCTCRYARKLLRAQRIHQHPSISRTFRTSSCLAFLHGTNLGPTPDNFITCPPATIAFPADQAPFVGVNFAFDVEVLTLSTTTACHATIPLKCSIVFARPSPR